MGLVLDLLRDLDFGAFEQHHVAGVLLTPRFPAGEELLSLDRLDQDPEPRALLADVPDVDRALVCSQAEVDDRDHRGLTSLRSAADDVDHAELERHHLGRMVVPRPEDHAAAMEAHHTATLSVAAF